MMNLSESHIISIALNRINNSEKLWKLMSWLADILFSRTNEHGSRNKTKNIYFFSFNGLWLDYHCWLGHPPQFEIRTKSLKTLYW